MYCRKCGSHLVSASAPCGKCGAVPKLEEICGGDELRRVIVPAGKKPGTPMPAARPNPAANAVPAPRMKAAPAPQANAAPAAAAYPQDDDLDEEASNPNEGRSFRLTPGLIAVTAAALAAVAVLIFFLARGTGGSDANADSASMPETQSIAASEAGTEEAHDPTVSAQDEESDSAEAGSAFSPAEEPLSAEEPSAQDEEDPASDAASAEIPAAAENVAELREACQNLTEGFLQSGGWLESTEDGYYDANLETCEALNVLARSEAAALDGQDADMISEFLNDAYDSSILELTESYTPTTYELDPVREASRCLIILTYCRDISSMIADGGISNDADLQTEIDGLKDLCGEVADESGAFYSDNADVSGWLDEIAAIPDIKDRNPDYSAAKEALNALQDYVKAQRTPSSEE